MTDPIPYSPQTRRAMTELRKIAAGQEWRFSSFFSSDTARVTYFAEAKGASRALALLAEAHRQYKDFHHWTHHIEWLDGQLIMKP